jgi:phage terminase large subunit GpA-like protein
LISDIIINALIPPRPKNRIELASEIILPKNSPKEGRFDPDWNPASRILLESIDDPRYRRIAFLAPTQFGKTFTTVQIPIITQIVSGEGVLVGVPTEDMATGLWEQKIVPLLEAHPVWKEWLPTTGSGSRGGKVRSLVTLNNGSWVRFLSAHGGDEKRSSHTGRVLVCTEVDRYAGEGKVESSPLDQMIMRTDGYGEKGRTVLECTVTTEKSRIWREAMVEGTGSTLWYSCPECTRWQPWEEEQLVYDGDDELGIEQSARLVCKFCQFRVDESARLGMIQDPRLVHRGQEIDAHGMIRGEEPRTRTFGLRCNVFSSPIFTLRQCATQIWKARLAVELGDINLMKAWRQSKMALPWIDEQEQQRELSVSFLRKRESQHEGEIRVVPEWCEYVTVAVDLQKDRLYWLARAWGDKEVNQVLDKGIEKFETVLDDGVDKALSKVDDYCRVGWENDGKVFTPTIQLVDCGYNYRFLTKWLKTHKSWTGVKGFGENSLRPTGEKAILDIPGVLQLRRQTDGNTLCFVDTTQVKALITDRYFAEPEHVGYTIVPVGAEADNYYYHLTSEERFWDEKKGAYLWRKRAGRNRNDFFDCDVYSLAGARLAQRKLDRTAVARANQVEIEKITTPKPRGFSSFINRRGRH